MPAPLETSSEDKNVGPQRTKWRPLCRSKASFLRSAARPSGSIRRHSTAAGLRGKVVLVDFWTYSCINWRRSLPYVRAWAEKYKDQGLVVIGVHAPEFEFEKNVDNVRRAAKDMEIGYPIAIDNEHAIWRAFENHSWPALYFVDAQGRVRHHHFGEGEYEHSELIIQQLMAEAGIRGVGHDPVSVDPHGAEAAADWGSLRSPENYLGYERTENFESPGGAVPGPAAPLRGARAIGAQSLGPLGRLDDGETGHGSEQGGRTDRVPLSRPRPSSRHGTGSARDLVRFRVLIDGKPPGAAHGADVDDEGHGTATEQRLYQLIRQPKPIADRDFEIEFLDPDIEVFSVTFG